MKRPIYKHIRMLLVAIPLLLAMAPVMAQTNIVNVGQSIELSVVQMPGDTYNWELYNDVTGVNFATVPGNCPSSEAFFNGGVHTGPVVQVTWLKAGTYFYKVTATKPGCSMNLKVGKIIVMNNWPTAVFSLSQPSLCVGQSSNIVVNFTGTAPWSLTYRITYPDGSTQSVTVPNIATTPLLLPFSPSLPGTYAFELVSITDATGTNPSPPPSVLQVVVKPRPVTSPIMQY